MQRTKIEATQQVPNQYRSPKVPINKVRGIHGDKVLECGVDKISERELSFSTFVFPFLASLMFLALRHMTTRQLKYSITAQKIEGS